MAKVDIETPKSTSKVDIKKNTKTLKKVLPKKEEIAVQYFDEGAIFPSFVITFCATGHKYSLFEIIQEQATLLGTSNNPITLDTKFLLFKNGKYQKIKK